MAPEPLKDRVADVGDGVSRRRLLGVSGTAAVAGVVAGAAGAYAVGRATEASAEQAPTPPATPLAAGPDAAIAFRGEHQAGIITPAQDRLHFVALDVVTKDRCPAARAAQGLDASGRADDVRGRGRAGRTRRRRAQPRTRGHRRGVWTAGLGPDRHDRLRSLPLRRPLRPRGVEAGRPGRAASLHRRPARGAPVRRRHLHPGLRQRPTGGGARRPQPREDGLRRRRGALVAARLRAHVVDVDDPGHAPQHVRLQGRHQQRQGRGAREPGAARVGRPRRRAGRRSVDVRRLLPRGAPHPHAHRGLGPHSPAGAGGHHRP